MPSYYRQNALGCTVLSILSSLSESAGLEVFVVAAMTFVVMTVVDSR